MVKVSIFGGRRAMKEFVQKENYDIADLLEIVALLRSPQGCPWDREQTHRTIRRNFLEEAYEAVEAIDKNDKALLLEELGDVLFQVLFHTQIEAEQGTFDFAGVCDTVCKKMILRHPHVFADGIASNSGEVLKAWDAIKQVEKNQKSRADALRSVPTVLPALIRADKLQGKAAKSGFYKTGPEEALADLKDEILELEEAVSQNENVSNEIGGVLFAAANLARHLDVDPEEALNRTSSRFISRFTFVEESAGSRGVTLDRLDSEALESLWQEAKNNEY